MSKPSGPSDAAPPLSPDDWGPADLAAALEAASEWTVRYRERVHELPVFPRVGPGEIRARLPESPPREPEPLGRVLEDLDRDIVPGLTHWNHPGFFAYFSSSTRGPSVVAELLIAALGVNAMLWRTSPAATELEEVVVDWLRQALGLPVAFRGMILDTASMSSFTAVLAARHRVAPEVRETGVGSVRLASYVSEQSHSSLEKAVMAAGLGRSSVRRIPADDRFAMRVDALRDAIADDVRGGITPMWIGATIGTTSTASVDPVAEIADVAARHDAWLHVDAAYAGPAAMLPAVRPSFSGWERADSIVVNPHKWLGTSLDCSVLFFRDPRPFRETLSLTPAYLQSGDGGVTNLMELALPLGRRFRALKLWLLFRCVGTDGIAATLRRHIDLASRFARMIEADRRFGLAAPVGFGTVCFRALAGASPEESDLINRGVLERLNRGGRVFLSHTELGGRYVLRLSIGSVHTRSADVEAALEWLGEALDAELAERGRSS